MRMRMLLNVLSLVLAASVTAGCASVDRGGARWDPRGGHTLTDQIPNEEGGAGRICCGHLTRCQPHQSPRC